MTNRPETENGAPPASGGVNSPNSWGSQASNNSYTEDIWTANGTWLVKDAQGNMTRVGSEAEAIAATGGNTDPTTPPVSGEGASSGGGASSDDKLPGEDWFSYWARKDAEKSGFGETRNRLQCSPQQHNG